MEATVHSKPRERVQSHHRADATPDTEISHSSESGAAAGLPLFLRSSVPTSAGCLVQRRKDEEIEDEEREEEEETQVQTKLVVGQPGDAYEQEADRVAEAATKPVTPPNGQPGAISTGVHGSRIQRACAACGSANCSCDTGAEDWLAQKKSLNGGSPMPAPTAPILHSPDSGSPLSRGVREKAEPLLRADLGHVRVHTGAHANNLARGLGAKAFTHKNHIWLGRNQSPDDVELMAHEATHVIQQGHGVHLKSAIGEPGDAYGGTGSEAGGENGKDVFVQRRLEVNAERRFESAGAAAGPATIGAGAPAAKAGDGGEEAKAEKPAEGEGEEEGALEAAQATEPAETAAPTEDGAAAGEGGGADGGAACSGAGSLNAPCYNSDIEEPEEEPEKTPPEPETTESREQMSSKSTEAEETDDCPVGEAITQQAAPSAAAAVPAPTSAPPTEAGVEAAGPPSSAGTSTGADAGAEGQATPAAQQLEGEADQMADTQSPIDSAIAAIESQRAAAVANYEQASGTLATVEPGVASLRNGARFALQPGETESDVSRRSGAEERASSFLNLAADRISEAMTLARDTVPERLGSMAESIKGALGSSIETQKQLISARIGQARAEAIATAEQTRGQTLAEYEGTVSLIEEQTTAASDALTTAHGESLGRIDDQETTTLDAINQAYAKGREEHEALGPKMGAEAIARGEEYAAEYERCKPKPKKKDSFFAGYLTWRRGEAQQKAARETAKGYKKSLEDAAKKQAGEAVKGRKKDRCGVIAAAGRSRETLDMQLDQLLSSLESGRQQAIAQADSTRDQILSSIDTALNSTLNRLDRQEQEQRQSANDTGYLQQVSVEQAAHAAAASVLGSVTEAVQTVQGALSEVQNTFATSPAPDRETLDAMLSQATGGIEGGMGRLIEQVESGFAMSEARLEATGAQALDALNGVTAGNDQQASALSEGFASQMAALAEGASDTFGQLRDGYTQQTQSAITNGAAGLEQVVAGFQSSCTTAINSVTSVLGDSAKKLEQSLQESLSGMDCEIQKQAIKAAAAEQPAWKSVVKWVLIIAIIVVVALVIGPAVIGAVGAMAASAVGAGAAATAIGTIVGGAIVGAATSATIQVVNNWASGQKLTAGIGKAALMGAIGGAFGAGAGALIGKYVTAQVAQIALNVAADAVLDVGIQIVTGEFSWEALGMAVLMSAVTGGFGDVRGVKGIQQRFMYRGAKAVPGSRASAHAESIRPPKPTEAPGTPPKPSEAPGTPSKPSEAPGTPSKPSETPGTPPKPGEAPGTHAQAEAKAKPSAPEETAGAPKTAEKTPSTPPEAPRRATHQDHPEVEPGVVAKKLAGDGHELKILKDGRMVICTDCGELKIKYQEEIAGDANLQARVAQVEAIPDPAVKLTETEKLHAELSNARVERMGPVKGPTGVPDFDAWGARLKSAGIKGDVDAIVARAKGTGDDALAAQGELRALDRARLRGHDVEVLTPPTGVASAPKSTEAKLTRSGQERVLEVKTATEPPKKSAFNSRVDEANDQISASGKDGEISADWTKVDITKGDFPGETAIHNYINGKMTDNILKRVKYFEIVWKRFDGKTMVTSRTRGPDGKVGDIKTEFL
jgi:Domain of unknown function (DUF4157)